MNERLLAVTKLDFDGRSTSVSEHTNELDRETVERIKFRIAPGNSLDEIVVGFSIERVRLEPGKTLDEYRIARGIEDSREFSLRSRRYRYPITPVNVRLENAALYDALLAFSAALDTNLAVTGSIEEERVTETIQDLDWNQALERVLAGRGLKWAKIGALLAVYREGEGDIRPQRSQEPRSDWHPPVKVLWDGFGEVYRVSPAWGVTPPTIIERTKPSYTPQARESRVAGIVVVRALIDEDGRVRDAEIKRPLPFGLNDRALGAVKQWKFSPATYRERPVPASYDVAVYFDLR